MKGRQAERGHESSNCYFRMKRGHVEKKIESQRSVLVQWVVLCALFFARHAEFALVRSVTMRVSFIALSRLLCMRAFFFCSRARDLRKRIDEIAKIIRGERMVADGKKGYSGATERRVMQKTCLFAKRGSTLTDYF